MKKTIRDIDLKGKKILIRVDYNVPQDGKLDITDDIRIRESVPTIKYCLDNGASKVILMSHLGRPEGQVVEAMRLTPVAKHLEKLLGQKVLKLNDCVGPDIQKSIDNSSEKVVLLENLRFYKQETKNDPEFAKQLASLGDVYVNDAFGTAHRAHASTEGVAHFVTTAVSGLLLEKEIKYLGEAVSSPRRPFTVILGGAKVSDKIALVENLIDKADNILIGGGMAYTFLKSQGKGVGNSKLEVDKVEIAGQLLAKAKAKGVHIELTRDFMVVDDFNNTASLKLVKDIPDGWMSLDIGPETRKAFNDILSKSKTIVWNGPVGVFEIDAYAEGTKSVAAHLATLKDALTIVGGGDSAAAAAKFGVADQLTHISTGGGASLEFLEGKDLPGIAALNDKSSSGCGCGHGGCH